MPLLSAIPGTQRVPVGESLSVSVKAEDGVDVSWWRDGLKVADSKTLMVPAAQTGDSGTYAVRAVKGSEEEIHGVRVEVTPVVPSVSVTLHRKWSGWIVTAVFVMAVATAALLADAPVARAVRLAGAAGHPDAALIAQVVTAAGIVLLMAGVFVGLTTALTRAKSDTSDAVHATAVDPPAVAKLVASLDRSRVTAALLIAGLLLVAAAALLAWRVAGAPAPADQARASVQALVGSAAHGSVVAVEQDRGDAVVR